MYHVKYHWITGRNHGTAFAMVTPHWHEINGLYFVNRDCYVVDDCEEV